MKKQDEINYEFKISNFNTIVGNQKEDIAIEFLEIRKWDETEAAKLYLSNVTLPNNSDSYFSNNQYNYIKECHLNLNNDLINKAVSFFKSKLKITKENIDYCKDFNNKVKGLVKDGELFMTSLRINKGIIILYNFATKNKLLTQIDIINNDRQNNYLKGVIIFPIIDISQEGKDLINQLSINRFPCYLFCKYKSEKAFYVVDKMEGIFYLDTFKSILCPNRNIIPFNSNNNMAPNNNKFNYIPQNIQNKYNSNINLRNNMNLSNSKSFNNNNKNLNNKQNQIKEFPKIDKNLTFPKNFNNNFSSLNDENNADSAPIYYSGFNNIKENNKLQESNKNNSFKVEKTDKLENNKNINSNLISNINNSLEKNSSSINNNKFDINKNINIPNNKDNLIQNPNNNISNNINKIQNNNNSKIYNQNKFNKNSNIQRNTLNNNNYPDNKNNILQNNVINNNINLNSNKNAESQKKEKKEYIPDYRDYDFGEELAYYPQFDQFNQSPNAINNFNNNNFNYLNNQNKNIKNIPMSDRDIKMHQDEEMKELERIEKEREEKEKVEEEKKRLEEKKEKENLEREKEEKEMFSMLIPPEPDDNNPDKCIIIFRLPDGEKNIERKFLKTDKIAVLYDYIKSLGSEIYTEKEYNNFSIIQTFPYKNFEDKLNRTLEEEGLFPNSMLQIKEID